MKTNQTLKKNNPILKPQAQLLISKMEGIFNPQISIYFSFRMFSHPNQQILLTIIQRTLFGFFQEKYNYHISFPNDGF